MLRSIQQGFWAEGDGGDPVVDSDDAESTAAKYQPLMEMPVEAMRMNADVLWGVPRV